MADLRALPTTRVFARDYGDALERHVREPSEATLRQAYELGRAAVELEVSVLELAAAHHAGLRRTAHSLSRFDPDDHLRRASDFLVEALTSYEMVRRRFLELREAERQQRHHAAVVRGLSALLADTSLATHGRDTVPELLQLVVEHARELTGATRCIAELAPTAWAGRVAAVSEADVPGPAASEPDLVVQLTSLDGSTLGRIALWSAGSAGMSELHEALVVHVAQMASAALDRAALFARAT